MSRRRHLWLVVLCLLGIALGGVEPVWGNRRPRSSAPDAKTAAKTQTLPAVPDQQNLEGIADTQSLPSQDLPALRNPHAFPGRDELVRLINLAPAGSESAAAFFRLARQAETYGHFDLAMKVYTLTASLHPGSLSAHRARLRRYILELYLDLSASDPQVAFRNFLANLSHLSPSPSPQELLEPLTRGWMALEQTLWNQLPHQDSPLEEVLVLWEMQPPGSQPPAGALVVGRLLKERGLFAEAGWLLFLAWEQGSAPVRSRALTELLEVAWASEGLPGFLEALQQWRRRPTELLSALRTWPLRLVPQEGKALHSGTAALAGLGDLRELVRVADLFPSPLEPPSVADAEILEALLTQPLPAALQAHLARTAAERHLREGDYPRAGNLYRRLLAHAADKKEDSFYYWDRLGLAHLRARQPDLATDIFQTLQKETGQFWQLLAGTRQLDVELNRPGTGAPGSLAHP